MGRRRRAKRGGPSGVLLVDKPAGPTSFSVVAAVRRAFGGVRVGHTGTLDPMATGLLPLCLGEATKIAALLLADDKRYSGSARLGVSTNTYDITGEVCVEADASAVHRASLEAAMQPLRGVISQRPPAFSAIRQDGKRAHERARAGEVVELPAREVEVMSFELVDFAPGPRGELSFTVHCGKGTYIRSLVHDLGEALGCGATLLSLRRTAVARFDVADATPLAEIEARPEAAPLLSMDAVLSHLPGLDVTAEDRARLGQGQPIAIAADRAAALSAADGAMLRLRLARQLVALGQLRGDRVWPKRVFAGAGAAGGAAGGAA